MNNSSLISILLAVINFLSIILIGGISYILKGLMNDVKKIRNELTALETEHNMLTREHKNRCHDYEKM